MYIFKTVARFSSCILRCGKNNNGEWKSNWQNYRECCPLGYPYLVSNTRDATTVHKSHRDGVSGWPRLMLPPQTSGSIPFRISFSIFKDWKLRCSPLSRGLYTRMQSRMGRDTGGRGVWAYGDRVSLYCGCDNSGSHCVDQVGLKLTEICLLLPP